MEPGESPNRAPRRPQTYWLTRFIILRLLGIVYAIAFLVAANQIVPLIGSDGLLPIGLFLDRVREALGSPFAGFVRLPSLFWFIHSDTALLVAAWTGFVLSCVVAAGFANAVLLAILWGLYMSFVHLGQDWYGYGWEVQLLETGFLAIFLCPLLDARPFPKRAPPLPIIWLFRWLIFRMMLGAGLINIFIALGLTGWVGIARQTRAQVLALKEKEFVEGARALGARGWRVLSRHILPSALTPIVVSITFGIPEAIFTEAALSFIGVGINPPTPSWGQMVGENQQFLRSYWYLCVFPSICIAITMLSFTFFGDGVRDALDPKMK